LVENRGEIINSVEIGEGKLKKFVEIAEYATYILGLGSMDAPEHFFIIKPY